MDITSRGSRTPDPMSACSLINHGLTEEDEAESSAFKDNYFRSLENIRKTLSLRVNNDNLTTLVTPKNKINDTVSRDGLNILDLEATNASIFSV